ncbi:MAG: lamin tail domain-containing protein [Calditrichaeota bacterium]|nr:lamin tail domain-containing protein [Calditrichota bacterium]
MPELIEIRMLRQNSYRLTAGILAGLLLVFSNLFSIVISEIMPYPIAVEDESELEWVELYNDTDDSVNLHGLRIVDAKDNEAVIDSFDEVLLPGNYIIIARNSETISSLNLEPSVQYLIPSGWFPMNNDGDCLTLFDMNGRAVDSISYTDDACEVRGRSLERIDLSGLDADTDNWGACADPAGHTAGKMNSLQPVKPWITASVRVDPNPFNPYQGEVSKVYFTLPAAVARISVDIYDSYGRRVRKLTANHPAGSQSPLLSWDGKDNGGRIMPIGRYIVMVEAVDYRAGKVHAAKCTVVIADKLK